MSDKKPKYVSIKEVVEKYLKEGYPKIPKWFHSKSPECEDIEDAEFEVIEPKQLPESNQSK